MSKNKNREVASMDFHGFFRVALAAGAVSFAINPSNLSSAMPRLLAEADGWVSYRVKKMRFRLHPSATITADQAGGFVGGVQDTTPATLATIGELLPSTVLAIRQVTPTNWVNVPKADLAGPFPWYKAQTGTPDASEEQPGTLVFAGTGTEIVLFELYATYEFKTGVSTSNTPAAVAVREQRRREREELARLREVARLKPVISQALQLTSK
jgi:hypothetical protein